MSKILNKASLLLNPAGSSIAYKEDKIFSVLPTNGGGDWNRTGGDGGTRVNQDGFVEPTPHNIYTDSNNFSTWSPKAGTFTQGVTDPFGGNEAWSWTALNTDPYLYQNKNLTGTYTISFYAKGIGSTVGADLQIRVGGTPYGEFTLTDKWEKYEWSNYVNGSSNLGVEFGNPAVVGDVVHIAFFQLNLGPTSRPYQPTGDRLNYPRISYENGRGALLTEPSRINLITNSATGIYGNSPGSTTLTTSPDGTENATIPVPNSLADRYQVTLFGGSYSSGDRLTYSWHYKQLSDHGGSYPSEPGGLSTTIGLVNCTRVLGPTKMYDLPNGWSRWEATYEIADGSIDAIIRLYFGYVIGIGGQSSAYFGHQLEPGRFATSYIPTTSAQVTRVDEYSTNITSFQSTGVVPDGDSWSFFIEGDEATLYTQGFAFYGNGTYLGGHYGTTFIYKNSSNVETYPFAVTQPRFRIGVSWNGTNLIIYQNGQETLNTTNVLSNYANFSQINIGNGGSKTSFPTIAVFPEHLSSAELQELTLYRTGTGGSILEYGPYTTHTFTSSGTFTPAFTGEVEVLVVAGGGGGGGAEGNFNGGGGGGGGAGGVVYYKSYPVTSGTNYTVVIGSGGTGGTNNSNNATDGANSRFGDLSSLGGGNGGPDYGGGSPGGSGGGAGGDSGLAGAPSIREGQGYKGGDDLSSSRSGAGGGGAGAAGENATDISGTMQGTAGGDGLLFDINGVPTYYAGGGGGGGSHNFSGVIPNSGPGGLGGGGYSRGLNSSGNLVLSSNGLINTGGGGGGGANATSAGNGGSGIVIVRYLNK